MRRRTPQGQPLPKSEPSSAPATPPATRRHGAASTAGLLALGAVVLVAVMLGVSHWTARGGTGSPDDLAAQRVTVPETAPIVPVRLDLTSPALPLPRSFLGLSTEYPDVGAMTAHLSAVRRILEQLRVPGDGPLVLRVGGDSSAQTFLGPRTRADGRYAFDLTPAWFKRLRRLAVAAHLRLLLDLNLAAGSPEAAARYAQTAVHSLPTGTVDAFEIGNEPDIYRRSDSRLARLTHVPVGPLPAWRRYTAGRYVKAFAAYAAAIQRRLPGAHLAGPELAYPDRNLSWLAALVRAERRRLSMLTVHRYPLSACSSPGRPAYSTIPKLISQRSSWGLFSNLIPAVHLASRAHLPLRLTELNSVTCQGRPGVSNSFATALWAPDAFFSVWRAGVAGLNLHVRAHAINAPFALNGRTLQPRPLVYGMIAFARSLGPHARLIGTDVQSPAPRWGVRIWSVRTSSAVKVMALDEGHRPVRIALHLPGRSVAVVQRLLGPGIRKTSGVTLDGQTLDSAGGWQGRRMTERIASRRGAYYVPLPGYSAALITVPGG